MKYINFAIFCFVIILVFLASCKKEKSSLIEPCELSKPVKADFWIGSSIRVDVCNYSGSSNYDTEILKLDFNEFGA